MCDERQSTSEGMGSILNAIKHYYPGAAESVSTTLVPTAKAQLEADKAVSGDYAALANDINAQYALPAAKTAAEVDDYVQQAASARELALAKGTGRELVTEADLLQRKLDPEYSAQREGLSTAMTEYLKASGPGLTENEREEMRRGMGRTSTNSGSAIATASKALAFGEKGREKTALLGDAISRVASALPAMQSGMSGFDIATRRNATSNGVVPTSTTNAGSATWDLANNFLGQAGNVQTTRMAAQKSGLQNAESYIGMGGKLVGSIMGGIMCWVAREAYGVHDPRWLAFRAWLWWDAPKWFRWAYWNYGEEASKVLKHLPFLKPAVRFFMNKAIGA